MAKFKLIAKSGSRIVYSDVWQQFVAGRLEAQFRMDADGHPMFQSDDYDSRLLHYEIFLFLRGALPNVNGAKYYLDDETFIDNTGTSKNRDHDFRQAISSFGDVEIEATARIADRSVSQRAWLSNRLIVGHAEDLTPEIEEAIRRIRLN